LLTQVYLETAIDKTMSVYVLHGNNN